MTTRRIALFPLNVVLFPGRALPPHIFESRYKLMVREILDAQEPFGIILAREHDIAGIGCTAVVDRVLRTYADNHLLPQLVQIQQMRSKSADYGHGPN